MSWMHATSLFSCLFRHFYSLLVISISQFVFSLRCLSSHFVLICRIYFLCLNAFLIIWTHLCFFCLILMLLVCLIPLSLFNHFLLIFVSFLSGLNTSLIFLSYLCFSHLDVSPLVLAFPCHVYSRQVSSLLVSCFETFIRFSFVFLLCNFHFLSYLI